jgi:biopolymer transport protein ExbD
VQENADACLVIQADQRVHYGTIVKLMNMADEVGVKSANMAVRSY